LQRILSDYAFRQVDDINQVEKGDLSLDKEDDGSQWRNEKVKK